MRFLVGERSAGVHAVFRLRLDVFFGAHTVAQTVPWVQQFSVRYPSNSFMRSKAGA